jgi:hypothetical protein
MGRFKPLEKILTNVVDTLGNKIGALPSTSKSIADYSDIINQGVRLDTADAYKNLFHVDTEFAKGYGGELKSGSLKYGSDDMPPSLTDKELIDAQNEIKGLTQDYLKDLPDDLTVYRYGDLDNETGVSSFTLNPNYNVDSSLPWQKRLQSPMQTFKVKKEDVLASPDINAFFGGGRGFDEQEIIISNDKVSDLGALPKNLTNAKKQGFDIDNKLYHATNSDNITEFREDLIGSSTDEGFFGKGFYFTPNKGEASYYGKNVGEYFVKGKLLDLTNNSGDYTLGGTVKFVDWAEKLDKIGMLDKVTKDGLRAAKKMHKYLDKNIEYKIGQNPDGTDGVFATIVDPTRKVDIYKGKEYPPTISVMTDNRRFFPKTKEEAKENLLHQFVYQMSNQYDNNGYTKSNDFFKGWNNDILLSLSDYIRVGGKGSAELTKKAKQAGYDGILAPGDEVVVFDPKNIRSTSAEFDPNKSESKNILASMGGMATVGGIGALSGLEEGT